MKLAEDNKKFLIHKNILIEDAISLLDKAGERILFVIDDEERLYGSISDGDIRRWILSEGEMDLTADKLCFKTPSFSVKERIMKLKK